MLTSLSSRAFRWGRRGALLVGLHLGCSLLAGPQRDELRASLPPALQFVSASLTSGPGLAPPPGTVLPPPELAGVVRIQGIDARRSAFRLTLVAPPEGKQPAKRIRSFPTTWAPFDPQDPSLIRWTCQWSGQGSAEGWSVTVESLRTRPHQMVTGPIQQFFLPVARPQPKEASNR